MLLFDVKSWLNSTWSALNDSDWLLNDTEDDGSISTLPPAISPPPDLIFKILETFLEYRISNYLGIYGYPMIIFIGTVGNALSFWVMTRKSMISLSTCFYMAVLAIADTIVLYFSCLRRWINYIEKFDTSNVSPAGCKIFTAVTYWCFQFSAWVLVVMTIDRFIAIHFPLKAVSFRILHHPKWIMVAVAIITALFDIQYFFIVDINNEGLCQPLLEHRDFHDKIWPWLDATIYSLVPFLLIIVFNTIIIVDNKKSQRRQRTLHAGSENRSSVSKSRHDINSRIIVMLLTVSFCFLIMSAPRVILMIIRYDVFDFYVDGTTPNWPHLARYRLVSAISNLFMYLNHSINFFLYCVSGQKFRQELKSICRKTVFIARQQRQSVGSTCTSLSEFPSRASSERRFSVSDRSINSNVNDMPDPINTV